MKLKLESWRKVRLIVLSQDSSHGTHQGRTQKLFLVGSNFFCFYAQVIGIFGNFIGT